MLSGGMLATICTWPPGVKYFPVIVRVPRPLAVTEMAGPGGGRGGQAGQMFAGWAACVVVTLQTNAALPTSASRRRKRVKREKRLKMSERVMISLSSPSFQKLRAGPAL